MIKKIINKELHFGKHKIAFAAFLWFALAIIAVTLELLRGKENYWNYYIYQYFYQHIHSFTNPYIGIINEFDCHYGPTFSLIIAPFTLFTPWLGCFLWCVCNTWFLYFAINKLAIKDDAKKLILLISAIEMMTSIHSVQFNGMVTAWLILAFAYVEENNEKAATFFIVLGTLTKIFGITGLTFFLFSKNKKQFLLWLIIWFVVLFCLPMLISSPQFIIDIYGSWLNDVLHKNGVNITLGTGGMQDISFGGIIRRLLNYQAFSDVYLFVPFIILYVIPLLKKYNYTNPIFKQLYLAITLITVVVLSSSSESPTFVIAVVGCALWYVLHKKSSLTNTTILLVFIFTSLGTTDLFPSFIRSHYFIGKSLKALPCVIVWLMILWELNIKNFIEIDKINQ